MFGNLAIYLANRATGGAVTTMTRWVGWGAIAAVFGIVALVFAIMCLFWVLEVRIGSIEAAGILALGCVLIAGICIATPAIMDAAERREEQRKRAQVGNVQTVVTTAHKEGEKVVDYFGPLQVIASAFLIGLRTGRQVMPHRR